MKPGYATKTNVGVGSGLFLNALYIYLLVFKTAFALSLQGKSLLWASAILFVWGCAMYAKGKGHHSAWGVLGLLNIVGFFILFFLPDRFPQPITERSMKSVAILSAVFLIIPFFLFFRLSNSWLESSDKSTPAQMKVPIPIAQNQNHNEQIGATAHTNVSDTSAPLQYELQVRIGKGPHQNGNVGCIYMNTDGMPGADRMIKIMETREWILADASGPGIFNRQISSGKITAKGMLAGLPDTAFTQSKGVWKSGRLEANLNGKALSSSPQ